MEIITGFLANYAMETIFASIGGVLLTWILKKIPNDKIKAPVHKLFYGLGVTATLGLAKWPVTSKFWNKIIEPFFIDLIDNIVGEAVNAFIKGLRSDNKDQK